MTELATVSTVVLLTHTFLFISLFYVGLPDWVVFVAAAAGAWAIGLVLHRTPVSRRPSS